jgi:hypothetical protein
VAGLGLRAGQKRRSGSSSVNYAAAFGAIIIFHLNPAAKGLSQAQENANDRNDHA